VRELLDELGLRPLVVTIGLRLPGRRRRRAPAVADRQKVALVRALLKRPALLGGSGAGAARPDVAGSASWTGSSLSRKGRGVAWVLSRPDLAERFVLYW